MAEGSIDFRTSPSRWRHWRLEIDGPVAQLVMDVDEQGGLFPGYELKLNSYDLGVDIELHDAITRLRFEHPEVKVVVLRSGKERVFCAGANIRMLAGASHAHKVNFCKFTNETRLAMEEASRASGQTYLAAVNGSCAGGGYELALAAEHIVLIDDGSSSVALPEVPLLAVLPGTGGLTRLSDKRKVRRDRMDQFCTIEEGVRGARAVEWGLVDETAPSSRFDRTVAAAAARFVAASDRPDAGPGVTLGPIARDPTEDGLRYSTVEVAIDRDVGTATLTLHGPEAPAPTTPEEAVAQGDGWWALRLARELDDALLHLRFNETEVGTWIFTSRGDPAAVLDHDAFLAAHAAHWLVREVRLSWGRVLERIDLSARSLLALIEPGGCFAGGLFEVALACDQSFIAEGAFEDRSGPEAKLVLSPTSFGAVPMGHGLTRLENRFYGEPEAVRVAEQVIGEALDAEAAVRLGLVTAALDEIDWEDEVRLFVEQRASFSPDALTGMEQNLRLVGPETMRSKIFGRLSAWQNWVFQRPNAVGAEGALGRYGSGQPPRYDRGRV